MSVRPVEKTPRALGYRMPAEWEPHEATWLAWPHNPEDWPGKFAAIPWLYVEIVRLLAPHERVHLIVEDAAMEQRVVSMLKRACADLDRVSFHRWPTDRGWTRDSGPIFVRNAKGKIGLTNWRFNAWAKYDD
ncbi:MAG: agmatine deiminase family protein, partial [Terracidiphilus sp.]